MEPNISYRNVHIGLRQGNEPGHFVSYCAGPVPCNCPGPVPVQCEKKQNNYLIGIKFKPLNWLPYIAREKCS